MSDVFKVFSASGEFLGELKPPSGDGLEGCIVSMFMWAIMLVIGLAAAIFLVLPIGTIYASVVLIKNSINHEFKASSLLIVVLLWALCLGALIPTINGITSTASSEKSQVRNNEIPNLIASDSDLTQLRIVFQSWDYDFDNLYNTFVQKALDNGWTSFWIGSGTNIEKRVYFDKIGSKWKPRYIPSPTSNTVPTLSSITTETSLPVPVGTDIPGTNLAPGTSQHSIVSKTTKPREVYSLNISYGQQVQIIVSNYSGQLHFVLVAPNSTSFNSNNYTTIFNSMGQSTYSPWYYDFTPSTSGTYYFAVNAWESYSQPYTISVVSGS
jgi:hypothetical protein